MPPDYHIRPRKPNNLVHFSFHGAIDFHLQEAVIMRWADLTRDNYCEKTHRHALSRLMSGKTAAHCILHNSRATTVIGIKDSSYPELSGLLLINTVTSNQIQPMASFPV